MIDETKLNRIRELMQQRDKIDAEINALTGGEPPTKRKWTRRTHGEAATPESTTTA
jgi:hypothetical protein